MRFYKVYFLPEHGFIIDVILGSKGKLIRLVKCIANGTALLHVIQKLTHRGQLSKGNEAVFQNKSNVVLRTISLFKPYGSVHNKHFCSLKQKFLL
jgi:hypothetical protein